MQNDANLAVCSHHTTYKCLMIEQYIHVNPKWLWQILSSILRRTTIQTPKCNDFKINYSIYFKTLLSFHNLETVKF